MRIKKYEAFRIKEGLLVRDSTFGTHDSFSELENLILELLGDVGTIYVILPVYVDPKNKNNETNKDFL